jgi:protein gp37
MGDRTAISWTEATWNPVTGCTAQWRRRSNPPP